MAFARSKLKVTGVLLVAVILALVSVVQVFASSPAHPVGSGGRTGHMSAPPVSHRMAPAHISGGSWYVIKRGETLANISHKFGVPVHKIAAKNHLKDTDRIFAGNRVFIPSEHKSPACHMTYKVHQGDTLAMIGRHFGLSTGQLARANGIHNIDVIYAGQRLCIQ
jgi:LysM repeat protein